MNPGSRRAGEIEKTLSIVGEAPKLAVTDQLIIVFVGSL